MWILWNIYIGENIMWYENRMIINLIISILLLIICTVSMIVSNGETGIGWFIFGLILIWNL